MKYVHFTMVILSYSADKYLHCYVLFVLQGPSIAPKKTVKISDSSSIPAGSSDGLPREDISAKITPTLLKNFESPDWKVSSYLRSNLISVYE